MEVALEIAQMSQHIEELYIKFNLISAVITKLDFSIEELKQYCHRNSVILHKIHIIQHVAIT